MPPVGSLCGSPADGSPAREGSIARVRHHGLSTPGGTASGRFWPAQNTYGPETRQAGAGEASETQQTGAGEVSEVLGGLSLGAVIPPPCSRVPRFLTILQRISSICQK